MTPGEPSTLERPAPVTLVITELDVGGAEKALVSLATGLDRSRWTPSVVALGPEAELAKPLREAGIETTCLSADRRRPWRAISCLSRQFRSNRPRLVQSFLFHANLASRLAARAAGIEVVLGGLRVAEKGVGWHLRLDRWTRSLSNGSVCVSGGVRRHAIERRVQPPDRLFVIPNGIDPSAFDEAVPIDRSSLGIEGAAPLGLFVGRVDRQKGPEFLIDAARTVARSRPDWRLLLVGDGPLRGDLEARTRSDPILSRAVAWLGRRADVPSLMKAADLLVLPSLWEGMPNVILEAMASGLPVVATRVEGSEDLVLPGSTGWLVPPGDPDSLASALIEAHSNRDRLRRFGEAGRSRVDAEFRRSAVVLAYDRLWSHLLGEPA